MWTATVNNKQITDQGYSVTIEFTSEKTTYNKTFTTDKPSLDWLVECCKNEISNLRPYEVYNDTIQVGDKIIDNGKP